MTPRLGEGEQGFLGHVLRLGRRQAQPAGELLDGALETAREQRPGVIVELPEPIEDERGRHPFHGDAGLPISGRRQVRRPEVRIVHDGTGE
jgi:hypothetical protein